MFQSRLRAVLSLAAVLIAGALAAPVTAQVALAPATTGVQVQPWPHQAGDLKPDPAIRFGVLPNGMRYAVMKNTTPREQVAIRLVINAGSMHEGPGQEGVAHLLEHMAFHGSTRYSDREMALAMANLGLRYGSDVNAGTSPYHTQYMFNVPKGDPDSVGLALTLLREFAGDMALSPARLETEREIVLAEERTRAGPGDQLAIAFLKSEVGDHPLSRPTIGSTEVIRTVQAPTLRAFYEAYYRPERATLIVVGDMDPDLTEHKIRSLFTGWRGKGPAGADPAPAPGRKDEVELRSVVLPGAPANGVRFVWRHAPRPPEFSRANFIAREVEALGRIAISRRIAEMNEDAGKPFLDASAPAWSERPNIARAAAMDVIYPNDVPATLKIMVTALRQIERQGVTRAELDRAVIQRRQSIAARAAGAASRDSIALAEQLQDYALEGLVPIAPQAHLALFDELAARVGVDEVNAALRAHINGEPAVLYFGAEEPPGGEAGLARILAEAKAAPIAEYAAAEVKPWPYTDFGPAGRVASRTTREDIGVTLVTFENGVRLTVKPTDFADDNILVKVRFGYGQLQLPRDALTAADFATTILNGGGLKDLTARELAATLAGRRVAAVARQGDDAFELINPRGVPPADLDLQMQLFAATVSQHGYRTSDWAVTIRSGAESDRGVMFDPERVFDRHGPAALHGGDMRWVISTPEQHASWNPDDAVAWIKPIIETYPLEVVMVGDITVEAAIATTAKTLGALPPRAPVEEPADLRTVRFPAPTPRPIDVKHQGRDDQALLVVHWPATDALANTRDSQAAGVLASVLGTRLLAVLRETYGRTYSPSTFADFSRVLPGYGTIGVTVTLQPQDIPAALFMIETLAEDLGRREIPLDEFEAIRRLRVDSLVRAERDNGYWFEMLDGAHEDPRRLDLPARALAETRSLTPADIRAAAARWLVRERAWKMTVTPASTTQAQR